MLLTEKQARGVICPMSKVKCLASGCMAWRWGIWPDAWQAPYPGEAVGYCGMAGKPLIPVACKRVGHE